MGKKRMKNKAGKYLVLLCCIGLVGSILAGCSGKKTVRVVIGSSSTSGDSYLIADVVTRYLAEELNWDAKVDPVGAAEMFEILKNDKGDGGTIAIFHDMMYLATAFGTYPEEYDMDNYGIGPRVVQNPGVCFVAKADAPYNTMAEAAEYLKDHPGEELRVACENGSVSTLSYLAFYNWARETYGQEVADQFRVIASGVTSEKRQMIWDGNVDIIVDDYFGIQQYVDVEDEQLAMKCIGLLDQVEGVDDVPTFAEMGITFEGEPFAMSKDFLVYYPKGIDEEFANQVETAAEKICASEEFKADLDKLNYRSAYLNAGDASAFIHEKEEQMTRLIDASPSFDYLTHSTAE